VLISPVKTTIHESAILPGIAGIFALAIGCAIILLNLSVLSFAFSTPFLCAAFFCIRLFFNPRIVLLADEERVRFYPGNQGEQSAEINKIRSARVQTSWEQEVDGMKPTADGIGPASCLVIKIDGSILRISLPMLDSKGKRALKEFASRVSNQSGAKTL